MKSITQSIIGNLILNFRSVNFYITVKVRPGCLFSVMQYNMIYKFLPNVVFSASYMTEIILHCDWLIAGHLSFILNLHCSANK